MGVKVVSYFDGSA